MDHGSETSLFIGSSNTIINPSNFIEQFDAWQAYLNGLIEEKTKMSEELKIGQANNRRLIEKTAELTKNASCMQETIDRLHKQLYKLCDLEDTMNELRNTILTKEKEIVNLRCVIFDMEEKHANDLQFLQHEHKVELEHAMQTVRHQAFLDIGKIESQLKIKDDEIDKHVAMYSKLEKERQTDITRITLEYENKIAKLQRQKVQSVQNAPGASSQEIFRRKLQHMKIEYEREIIQLKESVSDLQDKLVTQTIGTKDRLSLSINKKRR